jgi:hypothetical protein
VAGNGHGGRGGGQDHYRYYSPLPNATSIMRRGLERKLDEGRNRIDELPGSGGLAGGRVVVW